jgi:hypothetical protein
MPPDARLLAHTVLALSLLVGCAQTEPSRELYQWTDEYGDVRYTSFPERIPRAARASAIPVQPGVTTEENAAFVPATSAPTPPPTQPPEADTLAPPLIEADDEEATDPVTPELAELDRRIAMIEAQVVSDQEALKSLISDPNAPELRTSPELREISERLPALQAELESLRRSRETAEASDDGD